MAQFLCQAGHLARVGGAPDGVDCVAAQGIAQIIGIVAAAGIDVREARSGQGCRDLRQAQGHGHGHRQELRDDAAQDHDGVWDLSARVLLLTQQGRAVEVEEEREGHLRQLGVCGRREKQLVEHGQLTDVEDIGLERDLFLPRPPLVVRMDQGQLFMQGKEEVGEHRGALFAICRDENAGLRSLSEEVLWAEAPEAGGVDLAVNRLALQAED